jgi:glyoxylase-like metal-dependent hydrolase (beta-lactamase superfamily II)
VPDTPGLSITAVYTPGHTSNHTCWALAEERALFTGDHVMGWSTTVVAPPDGDMADYIASLRKVAERDDSVLWPTHGPPRDDASEYVTALVAHRLERERGVLEAIDDGRATIREIVALLYADVRQELHKAAGMSVWSHLLKLVAEGQVEVEGSAPAALPARYHRAR